MSSSADAEHALSLLNNLCNNDKQTHTLVYSILLLLYISFNKQKVVVPQPKPDTAVETDTGPKPDTAVETDAAENLGDN